MTNEEKRYAEWCAEHDPHKFYIWSKWISVRNKILIADKYECQNCRNRGRYTKADTVHHVNHFKRRPDLALEAYFFDPETQEKKRNLISLCHDCHEEAHGYRRTKDGGRREPITEERWD